MGAGAEAEAEAEAMAGTRRTGEASAVAGSISGGGSGRTKDACQICRSSRQHAACMHAGRCAGAAGAPPGPEAATSKTRRPGHGTPSRSPLLRGRSPPAHCPRAGCVVVILRARPSCSAQRAEAAEARAQPEPEPAPCPPIAGASYPGRHDNFRSSVLAGSSIMARRLAALHSAAPSNTLCPRPTPHAPPSPSSNQSSAPLSSLAPLHPPISTPHCALLSVPMHCVCWLRPSGLPCMHDTPHNILQRENDDAHPRPLPLPRNQLTANSHSIASPRHAHTMHWPRTTAALM